MELTPKAYKLLGRSPKAAPPEEKGLFDEL